MQHQQIGFTVDITSETRARDYHFKYLNDRNFVVNDLFQMGFSVQEINDASIVQMSQEEVEQESIVDDIDW